MKTHGAIGFRKRRLIQLLGEKRIEKAVDVLTAALAETDEDGMPTAHAIDAARYILDQVYGKAGRTVDMEVSGTFDDWLKEQKPD